MGSLNMDIVAVAPRHPLVGETVLGSSLSYYPGGKGLNQAVAAVRDGAEVVMLGAVGDDGFGIELLEFIATEGVDVSQVSQIPDTPSGVALIVVANPENFPDSPAGAAGAGDNTIVVAPGANGFFTQGTPQSAQKIPQSAQTPKRARTPSVNFSPEDVVLAQLEVPQESVVEIFTCAKQAGATTILNPAPAAPLKNNLADLVDYLVVNDTELEMYQETAFSGSPKAVIHTRGSKGVVAYNGTPQKTVIVELSAHQVKVVDTTAAGDCFCGVLAGSLLRQTPLTDAIARANAAAAVAVQHPGAAPSLPNSTQITAQLK